LRYSNEKKAYERSDHNQPHQKEEDWPRRLFNDGSTDKVAHDLA